MPGWSWILLIFLTACLPASAGVLDEHRWKNRLLVVFFADCSLREVFDRKWSSATAAARDRDLILLRANDRLRAALGIPDNANVAILIGKDGTEKMRWEKPPEPEAVFEIIDAMPMRQREARAGRAGP